MAFTRHMFPGYGYAPHLWQIADVLEAAERREVDRAIITIPPRHGKSELSSIHFPAWYLGRNPDRRVLGASYSAGLAYRFSRRARNLLSHPRWPFPDIATAGDLSNVQRWDIEGHRGGYMAAGVGGGIAGHGADLLMIDDPVSGADQADSLVYRERAWEWYTQDAYTRLEPKGVIIIIGTRWHQDDLIGRVLNSSTDTWHHIDMPAVSENGAPLWPARYDLATLDRIKAALGTRAWNALYQQNPSPDEGAILRREDWQYWDGVLPPIEYMVTSWDTAYKEGKQNDYTVGLTIGLSGGSFYVIDRWKAKVPFPELKRAVRGQFLKHRPDEVVVEDAASGQSLIQELADNRSPETTWTSGTLIPVIPFKSDPSKSARVHAVSPYVEGHRVYLPAQAAWTEDFVEEAAAFPTGEHDDQVDAFTQGILRLIRYAGESLHPADPDILRYFVGLPE